MSMRLIVSSKVKKTLRRRKESLFNIVFFKKTFFFEKLLPLPMKLILKKTQKTIFEIFMF